MAQIKGTTGNDSLTGTSGDDTITPLTGSDTVNGGAGHDVLVVDYSAATSGYGGDFADDGSGGWSGEVSGYPASSVSFTNVEDIRIKAPTGESFSVTASPALAHDSLTVTGTDETLLVNFGNFDSSMFVLGADGVAESGGGAFTGFTNYSLRLGVSGNVATTGAGNDTITGGVGTDKIDAGAGDDSIYSFGTDTIAGGAGKDYLEVQLSDSAKALSVNYNGSSGTITNGTTFSSIETLHVTTGSGADIFKVAGSGYFDGGPGVNTLYLDESQSTGPSVPSAQLSISASGITGYAFAAGFTNFARVTLIGGAGDDTLLVGVSDSSQTSSLTLDAGAGKDTVQISYGGSPPLQFSTDASGVSHLGLNTFINVENFYIFAGNGDNTIVAGAGADTLQGGTGADHLSGGAGGDYLFGGDGADILSGGPGDDSITGSFGNDQIDGGDGSDIAYFDGPRSSFTVQITSATAGSVTDTMGADGTDTFTSVEGLSFSDVLVTNGVSLTQDAVGAITRVLRANPAAPSAATFDKLIALLSQDQAVGTIVGAAISTTSVATLAYEFFTGATPTAKGVDYLVSPTGPNLNNLNSAYYQSFNIENRYINFAVNLGKLGEGATAFAQAYGSLSFYDAFKKAYGVIFGAVPTDQHIHDILDPVLSLNGQAITRQQYFADYGGDGANGVGTKAAAVGWLMSEAEKADLGTYAKSNDAFLTDVANGVASFGVDLIGQYARPEYAYHA